jgi:hypothetical protein
LLAGLVACHAAYGDSIKIGDKVYQGVLVTKSASGGYYVSCPEDGAILNVGAAEVDEKSIEMTTDKEARKELYSKWSAIRDKKKGVESEKTDLTTAAPVADLPVARPKSGDDDSIKHTSSAQIRKSGNAAWDPMLEQQRAMIQRRNAQVDEERRQKESQKYQQLMSRKVITSGQGNMGRGGGMAGNAIGGNMMGRR